MNAAKQFRIESTARLKRTARNRISETVNNINSHASKHNSGQVHGNACIRAYVREISMKGCSARGEEEKERENERERHDVEQYTRFEAISAVTLVHQPHASRTSLTCFQRTFRSFLGSNCTAFSTSHEYLLANSVQSTRHGISQPSLLLIPTIAAFYPPPPLPSIPTPTSRDVRKELRPPPFRTNSLRDFSLLSGLNLLEVSHYLHSRQAICRYSYSAGKLFL